jgi:hypothetical protein
MKIQTKAPNFGWKSWQDWALAGEYDVDIEKYVSNFVMLIINKYGGESNFGTINP